MSIWRRVGRDARAGVEGAIGAVSWAAMRIVARDVTDEIASCRLLVLAHPDDETIVCGGCIARLVRSGEYAFVAVATDGRFGRHDIEPNEMALILSYELSCAVAALGLSSTQCASLGFEDDSLSAHIDDLAFVDRRSDRDVPAFGAAVIVGTRRTPRPRWHSDGRPASLQPRPMSCSWSTWCGRGPLPCA